jgi:hypothetical protein
MVLGNTRIDCAIPDFSSHVLLRKFDLNPTIKKYLSAVVEKQESGTQCWQRVGTQHLCRLIGLEENELQPKHSAAFPVTCDRHTVTLRRRAYSHQHASRRNAAAYAYRTAC